VLQSQLIKYDGFVYSLRSIVLISALCNVFVWGPLISQMCNNYKIV